MTPEQEKLFQESLKNPDTEERIDIIFYRRFGFRIALLAEKLGITPNAITIASIFIGIGAGLCFLSTNLLVNVGGMLLLILADAFDSADGQLARLTKQYSRLGRILDGVAGDLWFISIYVCICIRVNSSILFFMEHSWLIWTLAVCAGACHALQAAMADYYRQLHLQCVNGHSELEDVNKLREGKKGLVQTVYYYYSMIQVRVTRNMQKMRRTLAERFPDGNIPQELRDEFRALSLPLMPLTNILSFNWRAITLFISLFLRLPWLYFVAELTVFNCLLIYMVCRHEYICKQMTKTILEWQSKA